jgi:hypothetical protein
MENLMVSNPDILRGSASTAKTPHFILEFTDKTTGHGVQSFDLPPTTDYNFEEMRSANTDRPQPEINRVDPVKVAITKLPRNWELIQPIMVTLTVDDDGSILVSDEIFGKYGIGESFTQAKDDYIANLLDYYEVVSEYAQEYPEDKAMLDVLQRYFVKQLQE